MKVLYFRYSFWSMLMAMVVLIVLIAMVVKEAFCGGASLHCQVFLTASHAIHCIPDSSISPEHLEAKSQYLKDLGSAGKHHAAPKVILLALLDDAGAHGSVLSSDIALSDYIFPSLD